MLFRFADLRHSGFLSLVAGIGVSDRPSCGAIDIIDRTASGFELYTSGGEIGAGSNISAQIRDLHHNGHLEFLLDASLGLLPQRCAATWTAIYAWSGDNYTNVSDQFKGFYGQRLDSLNKIIRALQPVSGPNGYDLSDKECLEAEASAIERFLGQSPEAGLDQAVRLAASGDRSEREFSTELLGAIGTPKARDYLKRLAHDPDGGVSVYAKDSLKRTTEGPMMLTAGTFIHAASFAR